MDLFDFSIAVIVACLASFRNLFTKQEAGSRPARKGYTGSTNKLSRWFLRNKKTYDKSNEMRNLTVDSIPKCQDGTNYETTAEVGAPDIRSTHGNRLNKCFTEIRYGAGEIVDPV